jgi:hypothetical protein
VDEYIEALEQKNRERRASEQRDVEAREQREREQGFNTCFSGANQPKFRKEQDALRPPQAVRRQWAAPPSDPVPAQHRLPSAKYMNPFELHPDAYPEEQHPKQERKKWGKKEPEPINAEEMAALGFRKEPGKFSSHDENAAERNQLLVTDNIL